MRLSGGKPPRWMVITIVAAFVASVTLLVGAWYIATRTCANAVENRRDHRIVWEVLIEKNPGAESDEFRNEILDVYLPALKCVGPTPTAVE